MQTEEYFKLLSTEFEKAYEVAGKARAKGFDPEQFVEIRVARDIAGRVEGIIGVEGLEDLIRAKMKGQGKTDLAFAVIHEICTGEKFASMETIKKIELAVKVGLAIHTDGVVVAPTEGLQHVVMFKNEDGSNYLSVLYAGPIRGAGGTSVALSTTFADYCRKLFNIAPYKPTPKEVERYVEEIDIYDARVARLQFRPSDDDIRYILQNCPICVDGLPTEDVEVSVNRDVSRRDAEGKEVKITNRIRGGMPLVLCEGIAQKAKKVIKELKNSGLDWSWLNALIKVDKGEKKDEKKDEHSFLDELVAGRPIFAYPKAIGGFRLRYGRSRFTGIAAMGVSPATMIITMGYMAIGTQLKMGQPRKGCVVVPVDSIEGPFIRLKDGRTMRVNDTETANAVKDQVTDIIALGDILITFGDFRNMNTPLMPTSYVEEFWERQLEAKDPSAKIDHSAISFGDAYALSIKHGIAIHPKYLYEFQAVNKQQLIELANGVKNALSAFSHTSLSSIDNLALGYDEGICKSLRMLNVPTMESSDKLEIKGDYAKALVAELGFASGESGKIGNLDEAMKKYESIGDTVVEGMSGIAPFPIPVRSNYVAARIGRPEKAKERLMKPAPNVLFPIGEYGGKERNITKAYNLDLKKFGNRRMTVDLARYICPQCKRVVTEQFCSDCNTRASVQRVCEKCKAITSELVCPQCKVHTSGYEEREIDLAALVSSSMKKINAHMMQPLVKGVAGLSSRDKKAESIAKGILRSKNNVHIFKDGTVRFDATDVPLTHIYPSEMKVSVEKLKELGYDKDYYGNELTDKEQLIELKHQDVVLSPGGIETMMHTANFIDDLLQKFYGLEPFYNIVTPDDLIGHLVLTMSPHTSCAVLCRIVGFTSANVGFAHPYTICARRRNADGDEDTTMLLMDALINFSRSYLPTNIGATMDAPLVLAPNIFPEEVDDEVHSMEATDKFSLEFYNKTFTYCSPSDAVVDIVKERLTKGEERFHNIRFTHLSSSTSIRDSPKRSLYVMLNNMKSKVDSEFDLMNRIYAVDQRDAAKKLILSHFIPDLMGNLRQFSEQSFRCVVCNSKYRRIPLMGKCPKDGGKLLLTVSKGSVEKYLKLALELTERYQLEPYVTQRVRLLKTEIDTIFSDDPITDKRQFNLANFI